MKDTTAGDAPAIYEFRLKGWLDPAIAAKAFPGMTLRHEKNGQTSLRGPLPDQAALFGIFNRLSNLAVPLLAFHKVERGGLPVEYPAGMLPRPNALPPKESKKGEMMDDNKTPNPLPHPAGEAVLVTGCSSGIGQAVALYLAMRSFVVLATVRREADAERLRGFHLAGIEPICPVDLSKPDELPAASSAIRAALERRGLDRLYAVVNNAGGGFIAPLELMDRARFRAEMETRVHGPLALLQDLLPLIRKARNGRILWITTPAAVAIPYVGSIHICEFAMHGLAQTLQLELSPWNIPNILIGCGGIRTAAPARTERELEQAFQTWPPEKLDLYSRSLQKTRAGFDQFDSNRTEPEDVARVVHGALAASHPKRKYIVGHQAGMMNMLRYLPQSVVDWAFLRRL
jgi:NAD(P)-dependent dehydrogenase (short-subunit alcohol dehydrogenase family)